MKHVPTIALIILLRLILVSGTMAQTPETPVKTQDSLADVARKVRPKDAQIATQRHWTDDDFSSVKGSSVSLTGASQESASETLRKFRLLGKDELGSAVLRMANAPDLNFPERKNWEQRLFDTKQAWVDQVQRMDGHKESNKDVQDEELRLTMGAQRNFDNVANQGIKQAQAVNDPVLKAHLQYERQLDFCKQTTGDMLQTCLASVEKLKWQMQREGTW